MENKLNEILEILEKIQVEMVKGNKKIKETEATIKEITKLFDLFYDHTRKYESRFKNMEQENINSIDSLIFDVAKSLIDNGYISINRTLVNHNVGFNRAQRIHQQLFDIGFFTVDNNNELKFLMDINELHNKVNNMTIKNNFSWL